MIFISSSLLTDDSLNIPGTESNNEDFTSFIPTKENFNDSSPDLSLDENEDEKRYFIAKKEVHRYNKFIFKTESAKKKRGPKKHKETKKAEHTNGDRDNIICKIQRHYFNFIFSFLNDCARETKKTFSNIIYKEKSKTSSKHLEKMKKLTILDILQNLDISAKNKKADKNINKMNAEELIKEPWFKKIFNMKYLDLFSYFYNDEKPLRELTIFDKKIILSEKTKSFYNLLQKQKSEELKNRIIYFCKLVYILSS